MVAYRTAPDWVVTTERHRQAKARPILFWLCRAAHGQHGYVIVSLVGANQQSHDSVADSMGLVGRNRGAQLLQADVQRVISAFDEAVGIEEQHGAWRETDCGGSAPCSRLNAKGQGGFEFDEGSRPAGPGKHRR
jgi:hypothetical protein